MEKKKMIITIITSTETKKKVDQLTGYLTKNKWDWQTHGIGKPNGWPKDKPWTESDAKEATEAAGLGLTKSDFCDDGADLQDLKKIIKGGS
tara:strand:+ start:1266 stop:1538 length:273 start_codon:yes stop_codon:yes gene_type:complete